jgi:hypothetical protein
MKYLGRGNMLRDAEKPHLTTIYFTLSNNFCTPLITPTETFENVRIKLKRYGAGYKPAPANAFKN